MQEKEQQKTQIIVHKTDRLGQRVSAPFQDVVPLQWNSRTRHSWVRNQQKQIRELGVAPLPPPPKGRRGSEKTTKP